MIRFWDPSRQYRKYKTELDDAWFSVMGRGDLILREDVERFEKNLAEFVGTRFAVGLSSGTDAIYLSLKALGIGQGDEVITSSHTFKATVGAIINAGAKPILVDIREDGLIDPDRIEEKITSKTKAIIPVHIAGTVCDMEKIMKIAEKYDIIIIEDSCQAMGAIKKPTTSVQCWSFYPAKILGGYMDGGAITTNDEKINDYIREARNHFKNTNADFGGNHRMDNLNAALLNVKFRYLSHFLARRKEIADKYFAGLSRMKEITLPNFQEGRVWQDWILRTEKRDELYEYLKENGIETQKNEYPFSPEYPKLPLAAKYEAETLRLPIQPEHTDQEIDFVIRKIKDFFS